MMLDNYLAQLKSNIIIPMIEYMKDDDDCGFSKRHIKKCEKLLVKYLTALNDLKEPSDNIIIEQVKTLVLSLNELNEKTDYCLLETAEREAICEIIQNSAIECGLQNADDDITEEWREW